MALVSDTYTPQVNGVTTVVARIVHVLRAFGHEVVVVAPRYPANGKATESPTGELRVPSAPFPPYPAILLSFRTRGGGHGGGGCGLAGSSARGAGARTVGRHDCVFAGCISRASSRGQDCRGGARTLRS